MVAHAALQRPRQQDCEFKASLRLYNETLSKNTKLYTRITPLLHDGEGFKYRFTVYRAFIPNPPLSNRYQPPLASQLLELKVSYLCS